MTVDVERLVRLALRRLRENAMFTTVVEDCRLVVDQVLCGIMTRWDDPAALEYRIVPGGDVHALSVAAGPDACRRVEAMATRVLEPFIRERLWDR